jgi:CheY-like chemotaxis protein
MLRSSMLTEERRNRALEIVERNARSLGQLVEDVLDVSRIVAGKIRLHVQPVDLPRTIADSVTSVQPAADAKGVRIQSIIDPLAPHVSGDPERLQQVLWNLLSNAVKFTARGGRVHLRVERINSHVEIVVSDTGVGIAPEFLPHVFERFRQGDSRFSRTHGGLGLGLAISRQLVEMHGGTIRAESDGVGKGATFRVALPIMIAHDRRHTGPDRVHPLAKGATGVLPSARLDQLCVLAVDDDPDALSLLAEILRDAGATVVTARSGVEAIERLQADGADVLIADIGMPGMDGFELIRAIRESEWDARHIPAAALTAYARSEDRTRALAEGFQMHLAKPIEPSELTAAVRRLADTSPKNRMSR